MKLRRTPKIVKAVEAPVEEDPAAVMAALYAWQTEYEAQTTDLRRRWNCPDAVA